MNTSNIIKLESPPTRRGFAIRKTLTSSAVLAFALLGMVDAEAAEHYVRAGASGAQTGADWSTAYASIPSTLIRGDTYYIAGGTYPGRTFNTPVSGTAVITVKKATSADHGTGAGWDASYDTQASFTGGFVFTSSYWIVDGQTGGGAVNSWSQNFGIKVTEKGDGNAVINVGQSGTANSVTVRHVDLQGKGSVSTAGGSFSNDGLAVYGASDVTLSYFRMAGIGRCPYFVSPKNLVVEHGWVQSYFGSSDVHSEVASIWAFSGSVGDVTFRYNLFTDIESTGGIMWDNSSNNSARLNVYGNVFYKPPGASWDTANGLVGGWTGGNGEQFRNASVYNNTFVNVDQESLSSFPNIYSSNVAINNLFYNSAAPNFSKFASHNYNQFINSGSTQSEANGSSSTGDPFVNMAAMDFRLKAATAAGAVLAAPYNVDPWGNVRGADGNVDRGAYEFAVGAVLSPPMNLQVR